MFIPYLRDPMMEHVVIMLAKVVDFGFTPTNYIFLKLFITFLEDPFYAYHGIIVVHEMRYKQERLVFHLEWM